MPVSIFGNNVRRLPFIAEHPADEVLNTMVLHRHAQVLGIVGDHPNRLAPSLAGDWAALGHCNRSLTESAEFDLGGSGLATTIAAPRVILCLTKGEHYP
jgi:hypothetical protein